MDKLYLYQNIKMSIPFEPKYQLLISKRESIGLKNGNDSKAFIEYSNVMDDIYKNIEGYNPNETSKLLTIFMIWLLICLVIKNLIQC